MSEALTFLQQPEVLPFSISLALMAMIGIVSAMGFDFDFDSGIDGFNVDADADLNANGTGPTMMDWVNPGRMPMLAALALFLLVYGLLGLALQQVMAGAGGMLTAFVAGVAVILPAWLLWLPVSKMVGAVMPRDHSEAVNISSLVGRVGVVDVGTATSRQSTKATFRDVHGTRHSLMVVMGIHGQEAREGEEIRLIEVGRNGEPSLAMLKDERDPIAL